MPIRAKLGNTYLPASVQVKVQGTFMPGTLYVKQRGTYKVASGDGPAPGEIPSLDFSDPDNSMYLALVSVGGM